ncbi:extensin family protein [Rhodobacter sp. HX-7-19]|uniref:Extensin family protein n=1 Tax=Paragemmobacter kunshanensis TaxID=2583234 RepID=A0A6M1U6M2_9RHOB|nr:extensin family protein [Rhodobacter kunshanensis]NGQ90653.1 extensin family protein [Rhodobacter kunshanensis]
MRFGVVGALCLWSFLLAGGAVAQDIATSPRPLPRPVLTVQPVAPAPATAPGLRPQARPEAAPAPAPAPAMTEALPPSPGMLAAAVPLLRPMPRPEGLMRGVQGGADMASAFPPPAAERERRGGLFGGLFGGGRKREERAAPADGFVCGDRAIRGEELARIAGKVKGCGIEAPVRVTQVDGIRLTTPATIDCPTAIALKDWINAGVRPAFGRNEVVELRIAASYICRTRNNRPGAKISEHGRGKAVDVSGFILADGRELSVARDYNRQMRRAHRAACGIFGTTLGPGSDGYHEDHLHFDTASHGNGPYCR